MRISYLKRTDRQNISAGVELRFAAKNKLHPIIQGSVMCKDIRHGLRWTEFSMSLTGEKPGMKQAQPVKLQFGPHSQYPNCSIYRTKGLRYTDFVMTQLFGLIQLVWRRGKSHL